MSDFHVESFVLPKWYLHELNVDVFLFKKHWKKLDNHYHEKDTNFSE